MNPVPMRAVTQAGDLYDEAQAALMWHQTTATAWRQRMRDAARGSKRHEQAAERIIGEYDQGLEDLRQALLVIDQYHDKYPDFRGLKIVRNDTDNSQEGWVYFLVREADKAVKIGYSKNPSKRVPQLTTGAGPCYLAAEMPGTYKTESDLHKRFAHRCVGGEWFAPNEELLDLIRKWPLF
jgi:hypothetical protein